MDVVAGPTCTNMVGAACLVFAMATGAAAVPSGSGLPPSTNVVPRPFVATTNPSCYSDNIPLSVLKDNEGTPVNAAVRGCAAANEELNPELSEVLCAGRNATTHELAEEYSYWTKCCHWDPVQQFCHPQKLECAETANRTCAETEPSQDDCSGRDENTRGKYEWKKQCCQWNATANNNEGQCVPTTLSCSDVLTATQINQHAAGCNGTRFVNGDYSKEYCYNQDNGQDNMGEFPWQHQCCAWTGTKCIPNALSDRSPPPSPPCPSSGLNDGEVTGVALGSAAAAVLVFVLAYKMCGFDGTTFTQLMSDDYY